MNSQKNAVYNNAKIKDNAEEREEKKRLSSSAKVFRNGVDRSIHRKEIRRMHPNSATLPGLSRKRPLPGLNGANGIQTTPMNVGDYRQVSFPESPDDRFNNNVFYSPVSSSVEHKQGISENKTFHDALTLEVLRTEFSAPSKSTYGLPRPASPENTKSQERFWTLINNAIESNVVTPLSSVWIENTHRCIPVELRDRFGNILEGMTEVSSLRFCNNPFLILFYA